MVVQFKREYTSEKENLNKFVKEAVSLFEERDTLMLKGDNIFKQKEIEFVLLDNLELMTNLKQEFDSIKVNYTKYDDFGGTFLSYILFKIKKEGSEPTMENVVRGINWYLERKKKLPISKFKTYIPLRMDIKLNKNEFAKLRKYFRDIFDIKLIEKLPKKVSDQIKGRQILELFNNRNLIVEFEGKARDLQFFLDSIVNKNVDPFIGVIAFANHCRRNSTSWRSVFSEKAISEKPTENPSFFLVLENGKLNYPLSNNGVNSIDLAINESKAITMIKKTEWIIHNKPDGNYQKIISVLKCLKSQIKNKKILEKSKDYFRIYYEGITEGQVEMAFLKFWILSEKIYKGGEMINDEKIIILLKKLVGAKYTKERIRVLYKKRNSIVHEMNCKEITEGDRNLSKALGESLLVLFIDPPAKFNNYPEFKFILENIFLGKEDKKRRARILQKISGFLPKSDHP